MDMPKVEMCGVTQCAYNRERQCHAWAITVGDDTPKCDTFTSRSTKGGDMNAQAGVGACKVSQCRYNEDLECHAQGITVDMVEDMADCTTFSVK